MILNYYNKKIWKKIKYIINKLLIIKIWKVVFLNKK
jgi:hypothetical protein